MPRFFRNDSWEFGGAGAPSENEPTEPKSRKRRLATTLAFTTLFFAGASLAAVAGDQLSRYEAGDGPSAEPTESTTTTEADAAAPTPAEETAAPEAEAAATEAPAEAAATEEGATEAGASAAAPTESPLSDAMEAEALAAPDASAAADGSAPEAGNAPASRPSTGKKARARKAALRTVLLPSIKPAPAPEIEGPADAATIWLNSQLPDPTPAALRLSPTFAANLKEPTARPRVSGRRSSRTRATAASRTGRQRWRATTVQSGSRR